MIFKILFFSYLIPIIQVFYSSNLSAKEYVTYINLSIEIEPSGKVLKGVFECNNPPDSIFQMAKGLEVEAIIANGENIGFQKVPSDSTSISVGWKPDKKCSKLKIIYSGKIIEENFPKTISSQNRITSQMLELTDVIDWYPRFKNCENCTFSLTVIAPKDFGFVTNGVQTETTETGDKKETRFTSAKPVTRLFLIGSAGLKKLEVAGNNFTIEIYHTKLPDDYVEKNIKSLAATVEFYQKLYNSEGSNKLIKIIYSSRPAGGYARGSLIIVSEEFAFEQIENTWGFARNFQLNAHEIAHLWSKANWEDDWINEGMAEFSAFLACEKFIGTEFATLLLDEYNVAIENSATQLSILETTGDSWESHINRYYKPTVLLNTLRQNYGEEKMTEFIALLNFAFVQNQGGTTVIFLNILEEVFGKDAFDFFQEGLNRKDWNKSKGDTTAAYARDFEGTWTGGLTQFGTTTKFVLHLKKEYNKLVPVLDSPDQNAFGIPISEIKISGDNIVCVVGVASATFSGKLDRNAKIIHGNWNQRGTEYPLELNKE